MVIKRSPHAKVKIYYSRALAGDREVFPDVLERLKRIYQIHCSARCEAL
jgi:hypothetical protein